MLPPIVPRLLTAGIADQPRGFRQRGSGLLQIRGCGDLRVRGQRADADRVAASRDAAKLRNPADVDRPRTAS